MTASLLLGLGEFVIGATVYVTATNFGELPATIPIHFGITGKADTFGPRGTIWLIVALQLLIAATYGWTVLAGAPLGSLVVGDAILVVLWYGQKQIIGAAISGKNRIDILRFFAFFAVALAVGITAARYLR